MADRTVRRAQTITPFGVGAIVDILGESFVAEDISRWRGKRQVLRAPRIAAAFGVEELRTPPDAEDRNSGVPYFRFPQWLFCGACRRMTRWSVKSERPGAAPRCDKCPTRPQLVPMRFVAVCADGHLDDVDWRQWAHSSSEGRNQQQCGRNDLSFVHVGGVGGGLGSLAVRCGCGAQRDLSDLPGPSSLRRIGVGCRGRQPWQFPAEAETCKKPPAVLQRGASSVYFPDVGSAIDIPPDSDWQQWGGVTSRIANNEDFKLLMSRPDHPYVDLLIGQVVQAEKVSAQQVRAVLAEKVKPWGVVFEPRSGDLL